MSGNRKALRMGRVALALGYLALAAAAQAQVDSDPAPRARVFGTRGVIETIGTTTKFVGIDGTREAFSFETTAESTDLHITFGAECAMRSGSPGARAGTALILDGEAITSTQVAHDASCSNTNDRIPTGNAARRSIVVQGVGPGVHVLEIETRSDAAGAASKESTTPVRPAEG
jgi:hypothetical protein